MGACAESSSYSPSRYWLLLFFEISFGEAMVGCLFGTLRFRMIPTIYSELGEWMSLYGRGRECNGFKGHSSANVYLLPRRHLLFAGTAWELVHVGPRTPSRIEAFVDQPACGDIV